MLLEIKMSYIKVSPKQNNNFKAICVILVVNANSSAAAASISESLKVSIAVE